MPRSRRRYRDRPAAGVRFAFGDAVEVIGKIEEQIQRKQFLRFENLLLLMNQLGARVGVVCARTAREQAHAIDAWRKQYRGEARVKDDSAITDADIASSNLVLFGDPANNAILAKVAAKFPIQMASKGRRKPRQGLGFSIFRPC